MKGTIAILIVVIFSAYSQVINQGKCPEVQAVKNFNESKFLGTWYEAARYANIYEVYTLCNDVSYALESNGSLKIVNEGVNASSGLKHTSIGTGKFAKNGLGEFQVYFINNHLDTNYTILGTDYDNYSSIISCAQLSSNYHETFAWLLIRSRNASTEVIKDAAEAFRAQNVSTQGLMNVNIGC